jgi:hypothetical protein
MFRTLKVEKSQKFVCGLPKILKSTNQNENLSKIVCLLPSKKKRAKNLYGGHPTEFAQASRNTIGLKFSSKNLNLNLTLLSKRKYVNFMIFQVI